VILAAPIYLLLGAAAAAAAVALHLIARAEPGERDLPTARFIPPTALRAPALQRRPSDLRLLAVRVLALLLLGLAFAGPRLTGARRPLARVVLLDRSRAVADPGAALARARAAFRPGDVLVVFDSTARAVPAESAGVSVPGARGALSAALAIAARNADRLAAVADSLELVLVSPLVEEEWDEATTRLRALWPGSVRIERVAAAVPAAPSPITLDALPDDPLRAGVALLGPRRGPSAVRLVRGTPTAGDSGVASAGGILVDWPADPASRFGPRTPPDTVGAVTDGDAMVVASFPRAAKLDHTVGERIVAWWVDGEAAATERPLGAGCVRRVAVPVAAVGDLVLRPAMLRFVAAMTAECGGAPRFAPLADSVVAALTTFPQPARSTGAERAGSRTLMATLLVLALATLIAEQILRRRLE